VHVIVLGRRHGVAGLTLGRAGKLTPLTPFSVDPIQLLVSVVRRPQEGTLGLNLGRLPLTQMLNSARAVVACVL
jgi:hypothetical protein